MGAFQRICTLEALCVGFFGFFLGTLTVYFAIFYTDGCAVEYVGGQDCHYTRTRTLDPHLDLLYSMLNANTQGHGGGEYLEVSTVYAITPTYARATQRVDLISICHMLMHVPNITWIVVEDSEKKTQPVKDILTKQCKYVTSVHLTAKSSKSKAEGRGVNQRNAGLSWIRQKCGSNTTTMETECKGVVYLMDDDNKYDLRLFQEIRKTRNVSVFPVAFAGGLFVEGPICNENGTTRSWHVEWAPERPVPVDMAGFAINVDLILKKKDAVLGKTTNGIRCRRLETCFLEHFTTRETAECIPGKEIMAWHVKAHGNLNNEKIKPSDKSYAV